MFKNRFQKILIIFLLSISSYVCAGNQENSCISDNVIHQAECVNKSNEKLKFKLKAENNNEKNKKIKAELAPFETGDQGGLDLKPSGDSDPDHHHRDAVY